MSEVRVSDASSNARSECDISLNHGDPSRIVAACNDFPSTGGFSFLVAPFYSNNGGSMWQSSSTNLPLTDSDTMQADPAVEWTSDGTAWCAAICVAGSSLRLRCYKSTDGGDTWTLDGTLSGSQTMADREQLWVDHSPTSPYKDQIYATWHNGYPCFVAHRTAGPSGTWQPPVQVTGAETTGLAHGSDIKTNAYGDVFVLWPDKYGTSRIDPHTIEFPVHRIDYIPIPARTSSLNHTALLTIDLPPGVRTGQRFDAVVRQVTLHGLDKLDKLENLENLENLEKRVVWVAAKDRQSSISRIWKQVQGTFQVSIPVETKEAMLAPEENLYSILQWIHASIPTHDRWYPVFHRYVGEIAERVKALGGDPALVPPSPTGYWPHPRRPPGEARIAFSGKVCGLVYDRFGDFEGFILDTEDGDHTFASREHAVEDVVRHAWAERIAVTVYAERHAPHRPITIVLRHASRGRRG